MYSLLQKYMHFHGLYLTLIGMGLSSQYRLATGWDGPGIESPMGGCIILSRPDRPWGPHSLLYKGYRVSFPAVKRLGPGVDHPPHLAPWLKKE